MCLERKQVLLGIKITQNQDKLNLRTACSFFLRIYRLHIIYVLVIQNHNYLYFI